MTNRKLATVFEAKVGSGQLIYTSIDLETNLNERIVARQLKTSLINYMNSAEFAPTTSLNINALDFTNIKS
ncbi:hypothetical protein [Portibacter lacus]|uniref:hypothetical protein n=1 Tax=Portibacter lacus TaxID=1099794 RepID=UPI001F42C404|nr:hypothetical protein [Portibacter lacus]